MRYLGTFIEELARKDYNALKRYEDSANQAKETPEFGSLDDVSDRSRLTIHLTLLSSTNVRVAGVIYEILQKYMHNFISTGQIRNFGPNGIQAIQEYMLLLILAVSHPAFSIEQKEKLRTLFETIKKEINDANTPVSLKQYDQT